MNQQQRVLLIIVLIVFCAWQIQRRYVVFDTDFTRGTDQIELGYNPPFYEEWQRKHDVYPYDCWTDDGYDPSRSNVARDIQLLAGMDYGKSDIDNGVFRQFFHKGMGFLRPRWWNGANDAGLTTSRT